MASTKVFALLIVGLAVILFLLEFTTNTIRISKPVSELFLHLESAEVPIYGEFSFHITDFLGSILACAYYRQEAKKSSIVWSETFVSCLILQFGGSSLVAFLLGQVPWWALKHGSGLAFLIAWWLTFCSPFDIVWKLLHRYKILQAPMELLCSVALGHSVTSWGMDRVIFNTFYHDPILLRGSVIISVFCGIAASTGGGVLANFLNLCESKTYRIDGELLLFKSGSEGDVVRSKVARSAVFSCIYLYLLNPVGLFPGPISLHNRNFGKQVICALSIVRRLLEMIWPDWHPLGTVCACVLRMIGVQNTYRCGTTDMDSSTSDIAAADKQKTN
jgi:hypothetical protein